MKAKSVRKTRSTVVSSFESNLVRVLARELQLNLYVVRFEGDHARVRIPARSSAQAARIFARLQESSGRDIHIWPEHEWAVQAAPIVYPTA